MTSMYWTISRRVLGLASTAILLLYFLARSVPTYATHNTPGTPECAPSSTVGPRCSKAHRVNDPDHEVVGAFWKYPWPMAPCVLPDANDVPSFAYVPVQIMDEETSGVVEWVELGFERDSSLVPAGKTYNTLYGNRLYMMEGTATLVNGVPVITHQISGTLGAVPLNTEIGMAQHNNTWYVWVDGHVKAIFTQGHAAQAHSIHAAGETSYWKDDVGVLAITDFDIAWQTATLAFNWRSWPGGLLPIAPPVYFEQKTTDRIRVSTTIGQVWVSSDHHYTPTEDDYCSGS